MKALALGLLLFVATPANAQSVTALYGPTKTERLTEFQQRLRSVQAVEALAMALSSGIRLSTPIRLETAECGNVNAFYVPGKRTITLCLELMAHVFDGIARERARSSTSENIARSASGAVTFVLLHELGHALIHALNLPILGREEDAADQISAFLILGFRPHDAMSGLDGAFWFLRAKSLFYTQRHFADEHSLDPQRKANLACWAYGKDPSLFQYVLTTRQLTLERSRRCEREYQQLASGVRRLLGDHLNDLLK